MGAVTKKRLARGVVNLSNGRYTIKRAEQLVDDFFKKLTDEILLRDNLLISGFGTFTRRKKKARVGHNPRTGKVINLPARTVVTYHWSRLLKDFMNNNNTNAKHPKVSTALMYSASDKAEAKEINIAGRYVVTAVACALWWGERVEVRGFGVFTPKKYNSRQWKSPLTGKMMTVKAKTLPKFRPSKKLLELANNTINR